MSTSGSAGGAFFSWVATDSCGISCLTFSSITGSGSWEEGVSAALAWVVALENT
tara:strand:+ start:771 stop:932 length:162 start_codon:yes stop_codon:yes gene_type:complete